ncbi:MAG TPA: HU family DNA-binding protein [Gaiellaceae bacterium]|nr:HU family DNA-binding protein [Gaiellaceae bacterium]
MTKQEFVDKIADKSQLNKRDAAKAVDAFLDTITESLRGGGEVAFTGFGKFSTSNRAARQGVNPRTGERVQIAASRVPKFSAGSQLKAAVKGGWGG